MTLALGQELEFLGSDAGALMELKLLNISLCDRQHWRKRLACHTKR